MDSEVIKILEDGGIDVHLKKQIPKLAIQLDDDGQAKPAGEVVVVVFGDLAVPVTLKRLTELFTGNAVPPDFSHGPTKEYEIFFLVVERQVVEYGRITDRIPYDPEFEELYRRVKRRPDGTHSNPIVSYIQAAFRLYMSLRDVSRAEFEAVAARLARSARTFAKGESTRNYYRIVSSHMLA